jgi:hypothetical protein
MRVRIRKGYRIDIYIRTMFRAESPFGMPSLRSQDYNRIVTIVKPNILRSDAIEGSKARCLHEAVHASTHSLAAMSNNLGSAELLSVAQDVLRSINERRRTSSQTSQAVVLTDEDESEQYALETQAEDLQSYLDIYNDFLVARTFSEGMNATEIEEMEVKTHCQVVTSLLTE